MHVPDNAREAPRQRGPVLVVGFGSEGRAAVDTLLGAGTAPSDLTIVDVNGCRLDAASARGLVTFPGDATRPPVLHGAGMPQADVVVVAIGHDNTAALIARTARELAPQARIVVSAQDPASVPLLEQAGADIVVVPADAVGRLMARLVAS